MDGALPDACSEPPLQRVRPIFALGAPLVGFFMIYTAVDIATVGMLGRLGNTAIAGVGAGSAVYGAICALLYGVDTGVQAIVSRATGAGRAGRIADVLAAAHAGAIPLAVVVGAATWAIGPGLVALILPDHAAAATGAAWIRIAAPSMVFLAVTLPINAAWIGSGRPAIATAVTAASAPLQVALTFVFVLGAGPVRGFGAIGGALAMDATMLACVFLQAGFALWLIPGFLRVRPRAAGFGEIAAIGWPISTQQSLSQVALMGVFAVIAQLGAAPAAIANVLLTITNVPTQTGTGLGVAAATLVGQALGRGEPREARVWGWRTTAVVVAATAPMGLALALAPETLLGPFLRDPATLGMAILPARIVGLGVAINTTSIVLGFAFRGAGATKIAAIVPFVSLWLVQLPLMIWIGLGLRQGLVGMVGVLTGVTTADVMVLAAIWAGASWTKVWIGTAAAASEPASNLRRIAILGGGGAGKSTLARRLGAALDLPVIHLDRLVFGPGWTRRGAEALQSDLAPALEAGRWIVEGTYAEASALTLPAADLVLWLDQPVWRRLFRSWRKTVIHRGRPRADRPDGCEEGFGWRYARLVIGFGAWSPGLAAKLEAQAGRPIRRLRGDAEVRRFLLDIAPGPGSGGGAGSAATLGSEEVAWPCATRPRRRKAAVMTETTVTAGRRPRTMAELAAIRGKFMRGDAIASSIAGFKVRPTDVIISPFGKCGTTRLQQMFHTLRTGGDMDFDDISRVVPWIETAGELGLDLEAPQRAEPRGFKSHLSFDRVPKGARYVVSFRDPRDALLSHYRFMEGWMFEPGAIGPAEYLAPVIASTRPGEGYWRHLISWWRERDNPDVLLLSYEHMNADPAAAIRRLADFCGVRLDDAMLELALERTSLTYMLAHEDRFDDAMMRALSEARCGLPPGSDSAKVRSGQVGAYKAELPPATVAAIDARWAADVAPETGFSDYADLEAAVRARSSR